MGFRLDPIWQIETKCTFKDSTGGGILLNKLGLHGLGFNLQYICSKKFHAFSEF